MPELESVRRAVCDLKSRIFMFEDANLNLSQFSVKPVVCVNYQCATTQMPIKNAIRRIR